MTNEIIIPILLSVIAFWLIRYINRSDKRLDDFTVKVDALITNMTTVIEDFKYQNISCTQKHIDIQKKFERHREHIEDHEKRITKLEK
jgi:hypothetical protein